MNKRIITAAFMALTLTSSLCYFPNHTQNSTNTVKAIYYAEGDITATLDNYDFYVSPSDIIDINTLKSHGFKILQTNEVYHDVATDPDYPKTTKSIDELSEQECTIHIPSKLYEGENIIEIKHRGRFDTFVCELKINIIISKSFSTKYQNIRNKDINFNSCYKKIGDEYYPCDKNDADDTNLIDQRSIFMTGDINMDNSVDLTDLTTLSLFLLNDNILSQPQLNLADLDANNIIDIADLAYLRQIISKDQSISENRSTIMII